MSKKTTKTQRKSPFKTIAVNEKLKKDLDRIKRERERKLGRSVSFTEIIADALTALEAT